MIKLPYDRFDDAAFSAMLKEDTQTLGGVKLTFLAVYANENLKIEIDPSQIPMINKMDMMTTGATGFEQASLE